VTLRGWTTACAIAAAVVFAVPMAVAVGQSPPWHDVAQCDAMIVQSRSSFDAGWHMMLHHFQVVRGRDGKLLFGPRVSAGEPQPQCLDGVAVATRTIAPGSGDVFLDIVGDDGAVTRIADGYIKDRHWANVPIIIDPAARPAVQPQHLKFFAFEDLGWVRVPDPSR
jgi:hypothetical protein